MMQKIKHVVSQCQVVFFPWKDYDSVAEAKKMPAVDLCGSEAPIDVSKHIIDLSYTKHIGSPAGSFSITLAPGKNWKALINPGTYGVLYLSQEGNLSIPKSFYDTVNPDDLVKQKSKTRAILLVDRITSSTVKSPTTGALVVTYQIQGRDHGAIYQNTNIIYNFLNFDRIMFDTVVNTLRSSPVKTVDFRVKTVHQLLFSPLDVVSLPAEQATDSPTSIALQGLLPSALVQALGLKLLRNNGAYYGNIEGILNITEVLGNYPLAVPFAKVSGNAWTILKSFSVEPFHELFPEISDTGQPQITFRPIPWLLSVPEKVKPVFVKGMLFSSLPVVEAQESEVKVIESGMDASGYYNFFIALPENNLYTKETGITQFPDRTPETGFPRIHQSGIRRYGLRPNMPSIDALLQAGKDKIDPDLLVGYNELMVELWKNSRKLESGLVKMTGKSEVKLGKVLHIDPNVQINGNMMFYIEGYEDRFSIDDRSGAARWEQTVIVSRGVPKSAVDDQELKQSNQTSPTSSSTGPSGGK